VNHVRIGDVRNDVQPAAVMRKLTEPLGLTDLAVNHYELEPGDSFAFAYHDHSVQEELFVVRSGTATFETESGTVEVGPDEAIRFGRGELQRGWNRGDERVVALAIGAPLEYGESRKLRACPACEDRTDSRLEREPADDGDDGGEVVVAYCRECGAETGRWVEGSMPGEVP
jgi:uncharacterized cupin superfamily protein